MKKLLCATFLAATISPFAMAPAAMAQDAAGMPEETGDLVTATATLEGDGIEGTACIFTRPAHAMPKVAMRPPAAMFRAMASMVC
jgi:hypothetical protein